MFFVNMTQFDIGLNLLNDNIKLLQRRLGTDKIAHRLFHQLLSNYYEIEATLTKFNSTSRQKRALINVLGKAIKFIAGNPDDDDLQNINKNLNSLYLNQKSELEKIDKLTTFANHLSKRYANDLMVLQSNIKTTRNYIYSIKEGDDVKSLIENEIYNAENLLNKIQIVERSIGLSWKGIPNLELLTADELTSIKNYLMKNYNPNNLILDEHVFEIIENSKFYMIGTNKAITFVLKFPILKPFLTNYSQIYPLPNHQDIVIMPPARFLLEADDREYWTNEICQNSSSTFLCTVQPLQDVCSLNNIHKCPTAKIVNDYKIIQNLYNHELLILFKEKQNVTENCHGHLSFKTIQGMGKLSSRCKIVIDTITYDNIVPTYEIPIFHYDKIPLKFNTKVKLELRHLKNPEELKREATEILEQPIHLKSLVHIIHYGFTMFPIIIIIIGVIILWKYKSRLTDLFCKPRRIIKIETTDIPVPSPTLNEDVQDQGGRSYVIHPCTPPGSLHPTP